MPQNDAGSITPIASRPEMPEYGLLDAGQGRGLLPWPWAQERLERAHRYWVSSTRPDGSPHAAPVWGIWWKDVFYFSTGRLTRKARNLAQNPRCVVCIEDEAEAVILEGSAGLISASAVLRQLSKIFQRKYGLGFPGDLNVYAVRPAVVFAFIDGEDFSGSATRWRFEQKT